MDKPGVASSFPDHCFDNDGNLDLDGTANVYTAKTARTIQGNYKGLRICGRIPVANTGASTLAVDDAPAAPIRKAGNAAVASGDLAAGTYYDFIYDDANNVWQVDGPLGGGTTAPTAGDGIIIVGSTISGALGRRFVADVSAGISLTEGDRATQIVIGAGTGTITFDTVASLQSDFWCYIKNQGTGDVTLLATGGDNIDGLSSWVLYPGGMILLQTAGAGNWRSSLLASMTRVFTVNDTWIKPGAGAGTGMEAFIELWAGGASGGVGVAANRGSGGGGGGAYSFRELALSSLSAAVSVTIGAGGTAVTTASTAGNVGGQTSFGAYVNAFGGGGGGSGSGTTAGPGGGGGGNGAAGGTGGTTSTVGASGPAFSGLTTSPFAGGTGGGSTAIGAGSDYGGAGGGGGSNAAGGADGGVSLYGGGGGGGGEDGGPAAGAGGTSKYGGNGGAGAFDAAAATAGSIPGGGGGGSETGNSGAGARGEVRVTVRA